MHLKIIASAFALLFFAELGDKSQLVIISLTASTGRPLSVFLGGAGALVLVTLLGIVAGGFVTRFVPIEFISKAAAVGFIGIGVLMLFGKF